MTAMGQKLRNGLVLFTLDLEVERIKHSTRLHAVACWKALDEAVLLGSTSQDALRVGLLVPSLFTTRFRGFGKIGKLEATLYAM